MARKRKAPAFHEGIPAEQIPWVTKVTVHSVSENMVVLVADGMRLQVERDGALVLSFSSQALISRYMERDSTRTEELQQRFFTLPETEWVEWLRHWAEPPPSVTFRQGRVVSEWPGGAWSPPRRLGELGLDDTSEWTPYFKGDRFRFAHFKTQEGEEGAVVQWYDTAKQEFEPPIAYIGDFAGYMRDQSLENTDQPEYWLEVDELFENTPMWALERMGSFDRPGILLPQVLEAVAMDSELLLNESIEKMLRALDAYPADVQESVSDAAQARGLR